MKRIIDTNILFTAINDHSTGHARMRAWLDRVKPDGWAVTVETYLGVIRLLMNPVVMEDRDQKAAKAVDAVRRELSGPHPGKIIGGEPDDALLKKAQGHKQIMDFYLAQVARDTGAKLATRDSGLIAEFPTLTEYPI